MVLIQIYIRYGSDFLGMTPKVKKRKINKLNFTQIKKFCASNDTIKRGKGHPTEWERIFANYISDKGLISKFLRIEDS